jgi:hypothetical protein
MFAGSTPTQKCPKSERSSPVASNAPKAIKPYWIGLLSLMLTLGQAAIALAQSGSMIWSGTGQILSGEGQGATLQLVLEMGNGRIRTQSGPALDAPYSGNAETITSGEGVWQIEPQGNHLSVTYYRGDQIIRYQLRPSGDLVPAVRPLNNGAIPQPVVPVVQELIVPGPPSP